MFIIDHRPTSGPNGTAIHPAMPMPTPTLIGTVTGTCIVGGGGAGGEGEVPLLLLPQLLYRQQ